MFFGGVLMMIQLSPLYLENRKNLSYKIQEGTCCVLRSQSLESTVKFGGLSDRKFADSAYHSPRSPLFSQTVTMKAQLSTDIIYVSTVHFLLHYFSTFFVRCGSCLTSACLTISGCGRSRKDFALCNDYNKAVTKCQ